MKSYVHLKGGKKKKLEGNSGQAVEITVIPFVFQHQWGLQMAFRSIC